MHCTAWSYKGNSEKMKIGVIIRANMEHSDNQIWKNIRSTISILKRSHYISIIIIAVPDNNYHRNLIIDKTELHIYYGNPVIMISRMLDAAKFYKLDTIVDIAVRSNLEPVETIDQMIEFHKNRNGGYTEPYGCHQNLLPKIIDTHYLLKVKNISSDWPYYGTIYSACLEKNHFHFPFNKNDTLTGSLEKMDIMHLVSLSKNIRLLLQNSKHNANNPEFWVKRAENLLSSIVSYKKTKDVSVLEIGCGQRFGLGIILYLMGINQYVGVDIDPVRINKHDINLFCSLLNDATFFSNKFTRNTPVNIDHQNTNQDCHSFLNENVKIISPLDASSLPFEDNSFDIVFSDVVLEHVENPELVCHQMSRVLKPGGFIFSSIGFEDHYPGSHGLRHLYVSKESWHRSYQQVFINLYRFSDFKKIFKQNKLHLIKCDKKMTACKLDIKKVHDDYNTYKQEELMISSVFLTLCK